MRMRNLRNCQKLTNSQGVVTEPKFLILTAHPHQSNMNLLIFALLDLEYHHQFRQLLLMEAANSSLHVK